MRVTGALTVHLRTRETKCKDCTLFHGDENATALRLFLGIDSAMSAMSLVLRPSAEKIKAIEAWLAFRIICIEGD